MYCRDEICGVIYDKLCLMMMQMRRNVKKQERNLIETAEDADVWEAQNKAVRSR